MDSSEFFRKNNEYYQLTNSDNYTERLVRLPFFFELEINKLIDVLKKFH